LANSGGKKRPDPGPFSKAEKAKEDRRFESPSLQRRVAANHYLRPFSDLSEGFSTVIKHDRYYWLLLAEGNLTRRLFGGMLRRM